jgi:hypothetical protein
MKQKKIKMRKMKSGQISCGDAILTPTFYVKEESISYNEKKEIVSSMILEYTYHLGIQHTQVV